MPPQDQAVTTRIAAGIGEIVLNRPARRNALDTAMCVELREAAERMGADGSVRVVIVRGAGPAFCAGADRDERQGMSADAVRARRLKAFAAYDALEGLAVPAIAMVHGACVGSGGEIAAACDFILASDDATFRYPEAVGGTVGATQRLPRRVGLARAKELLFTGRVVSASEAVAWGLVNRVVPASELEAAVLAMARQIADAPAAAIRLTKRCLEHGARLERSAALAAEVLAIEELLNGPDWKAAIAPPAPDEKR